MKQYEPCIQIIIIIIGKKDKIKKGKAIVGRERECVKREKRFYFFFFLSFSLRSTEIGL